MNKNNGTYVAVKFREDTKQVLYQYALMNGIPNPLEPEEYHSTIVYSRNSISFSTAERDLDPIWTAVPLAFDVFEGVVDDRPGNCCVLKIKSFKMNMRHFELRKHFNATHDFPTYETHVTLSYDIGDFDVSKLRDIEVILPKLYITTEFNEELKDVGSPKA
jgi:hypothetical protein